MKLVIALLLTFATAAFAVDPNLNQVSKGDLIRIGNEIAVNFAHTAVAAPETEGDWGIEVGVVGGYARSPHLSDTIDDNGGDGSQFTKIPHGGVMARAHFVYDLFVEATYFPKRTFSDLEVGSKSAGIGWNAGRHFGLPLDLAIGVQGSASDLNFSQVINNSSTGNTDVNSDIKFHGISRSVYVAVSKNFLFVTPYAKVGTMHTNSDVKIDASGGGTIFTFSDSQKQMVTTNGSYFALGANLQFFFMRIGLEVSRANQVSAGTAKLAVAF